MKRVLRFISGTLEHGICLHKVTSFDISGYSDADWAGDIRRSHGGYAVHIGGSLVSWHSKKQNTVSRESEYRSIANTVAELEWVRSLMNELHIPTTNNTVL